MMRDASTFEEKAELLLGAMSFGVECRVSTSKCDSSYMIELGGTGFSPVEGYFETPKSGPFRLNDVVELHIETERAVFVGRRIPLKKFDVSAEIFRFLEGGPFEFHRDGLCFIVVLKRD